MILAAIVMMASTSVFAQHEVGSVTLQPRAGVNIANFTEADGADPRIGLAAGAELEYQMNSWMSLAGGVMYSMQGSKEEILPELIGTASAVKECRKSGIAKGEEKEC